MREEVKLLEKRKAVKKERYEYVVIGVRRGVTREELRQSRACDRAGR